MTCPLQQIPRIMDPCALKTIPKSECSLASATEIVGKTEIVHMLIEVNQTFSSSGEQCKMSHILDLMMNKNWKKKSTSDTM